MMMALPPKQALTSADIADSIKSVLRYMTTRDEPYEKELVSLKQFDIVKAQLDKLESEVAITENKLDQI